MSGLREWVFPTFGDYLAVVVWAAGAVGLGWLWVTQRRLDRSRDERRWRDHANRYRQ